jgi:hypothetical protein
MGKPGLYGINPDGGELDSGGGSPLAWLSMTESASSTNPLFASIFTLDCTAATAAAGGG